MKIQRTDYKCVNGVYVDNHRTGIREINYDQMIAVIHNLNKRLTRKPYLTCDRGKDDKFITIHGWHPQYDCYVEYCIMFAREDFSDFFKWRYWQAEWDS